MVFLGAYTVFRTVVRLMSIDDVGDPLNQSSTEFIKRNSRNRELHCPRNTGLEQPKDCLTMLSRMPRAIYAHLGSLGFAHQLLDALEAQESKLAYPLIRIMRDLRP